ncbi:hypothetical protein MKX03_004987 [Papaver bracteatum]|nr:hypothetical protein MKX03_004987 [Papaver bracteatum]
MEGKSPAPSAMMMSLLLTAGLLFIAHTPAEAKFSDCTTDLKKACYVTCKNTINIGCDTACFCNGLSGSEYPLNYRKIGNFLNTAGDEAGTTEEAHATNEFCKLGCASSVCSKFVIALHKSAGGESVKEAAELCYNACLQLCDKKSDVAVGAAN